MLYILLTLSMAHATPTEDLQVKIKSLESRLILQAKTIHELRYKLHAKWPADYNSYGETQEYLKGWGDCEK